MKKDQIEIKGNTVAGRTNFVRRSPSAICHSSFLIFHSPFAIRHLSSFILLSSFLSSFFIFHFSSSAATPSVCNPYTFVGRVMDANHDAFGSNRVARIEATNADGDLLAKTKTFFRADSRRNYALQIPMATTAVEGYAVQSTTLDIAVTDDMGKVWSGVVVNPEVGVSGAVREVDIVLGEDLDGDGIDDSLYAKLEAQWEESDYWRYGEVFDPSKDYDGDGISTIAEALAGTDPFNPDDMLKITAFAQAGASRLRAAGLPPMALSFDAIGGRSYTVEEATSLTAKDWKAREFFLPDSDVPVNVLSVPSGSGRSGSTVYLLPSVSSNAFFRVRAE